MSTSVKYPELPGVLKGRISWRMLRFFGAGAIIASVTIGSGETLFASRGGAIFGYALLWCFVGGAIMKGVQVYTGARYMTLTGQHPIAAWMHLPGPRGWFPGFLAVTSLLCFPFWLGGLPLMIGKTLNWMFGATGADSELLMYARLWGSACIILASVLTIVQSYGLLEKIQTFIVGVLLLSILAAFFATTPDWIAIVQNTFLPSVPHYPAWMIESQADKIKSIVRWPEWVEVGVYLGAVGGGTYDYLGYLGFYREKRWGAIDATEMGSVTLKNAPAIDVEAENVHRGRRWLRPVKIDVGVSFFCVLLFTICFVVLGAEILFTQYVDEPPVDKIPGGHDLLSPQAAFLTQFHPSLKYLYQLGVFVAFWGTIHGAYELYTRTTREALSPLIRAVQNMPMPKLRRIVVLYCAIGGLVLMWLTEKPEDLVKPAAIVGGVLTCGLWCLAMIWTDRRFVPKPLRMNWALVAITFISGIALTGTGVLSLWKYIAKVIG